MGVYSTVQYSTLQYSTVQYSTVQYSTVVIHNECSRELEEKVYVNLDPLTLLSSQTKQLC